MSNLINLNSKILIAVYEKLNDNDRIVFNEFYMVFLSNPAKIVYSADRSGDHSKGKLFFKNVISLKVSSKPSESEYLGLLNELKEVDLTNVTFTDIDSVEKLVSYLPKNVSSIIVENRALKESFDRVKHIQGRHFLVESFECKKRKLEEDDSSSAISRRRIRTPSPISDLFEKEQKSALFFKNRLKSSFNSPKDFIPRKLFQKFTDLPSDYRAIIDGSSFQNILDDNPSETQVNNFINECSGLFVHSFVRTNENNWLFITQIEAYYHSKTMDDVSQFSKNNNYPKNFVVEIEKCAEGKGVWYELKIRYKKVEIIATGGIYNRTDNNSNLGAFLGVSIPSALAHNTRLILFSPIVPTKSLSCIRMLRNYQKDASLKKWCFKSSFFNSMGFATPNQFKLHRLGRDDFVSACSILLRSIIFKDHDYVDFDVLERHLKTAPYWGTIELLKTANKFDVQKVLEKATFFKLSKPKKLLISIVLRRPHTVSNSDLMILYNGIISPVVKNENRKSIRIIEN
ncbi:hypothetical protein BDF21DRAFT_353063 [Thamnidium elegans]|nr:hypothetical protein BDF21DRAFT_353063 [Thamnidium elegans]